MGIVEDLDARLGQLKTLRQPWEPLWEEIADLAYPTASAAMRQARGGNKGYDSLSQPPSREGARRRFDSLPARGGLILASGMESLTTPQGEYWHGYASDDPVRGEESDEETRYFERLTKFVFGRRYDPRSGFLLANQMSGKNAVFLGTGIIFAEPNLAGGGDLPIFYRSIPISTAYLDMDERDEIDTCFRDLSMTARTIKQRYESTMSANVRSIANSTTSMTQTFNVVHACFPRQEIGSSKSKNRRSKWASFVYETQSKTILDETGYDEFPYAVEHWDRVERSPWGESPIGMAIDDIRSLNFTRKTAGNAMQLNVRPPVATAFEGVMNRPNLNPGANNPGALFPTGEPKIKRILEQTNLQHIIGVVEFERKALQTAIFTEFFQTLAQRPEMTATEALILLQEKGDILGPAGSKRQSALARMGEREIAIYAKAGLFSEGSAYKPPASLSGAGFGFKWTSPLEQTRKAKAAVGAQRLMAAVAPMLAEPQVWSQEFNISKSVEVFRGAFGAPKEMLASDAEKRAAREEAQRQMQMKQLAEMAPAMAGAAKDGADALSTVAQTPGAARGLSDVARAGAAAAA